MSGPLEPEVQALARRIAAMGKASRASIVESSWWTEQMLEWAMSHPSFKTQLFRFVDVFPATVDDADVLRHLSEYFDDAHVPRVLDLGLEAAEHLPLGRAAAAAVARRNIGRVARQFIVGTDGRQAAIRLHELWREGRAFTVDLLGEKTLSCAEADRYAARVGDLLTTLTAATAGWAPDEHLEHDDLGALPRVNVSLKATALAPRLAPLSAEDGLTQAKDRLRPLLESASSMGAFVHLDTEHYDVKELTFDLFRQLLAEPALAGVEAGVVVQAYLRDSHDDLRDLVAFSAARERPLTVRLVKGAYWDTETVTARAAGWPEPVFGSKAETDDNYERCVRLLHDSHGKVRAAFGTHNLRSLAYAVAYARSVGIPDNGYEIQLLSGMAEPVHAAVRRMGLRLRVYAPVGDLVPGMAYLVRRLLENTANESFVRRRYVDGESLADLIAPPVVADPRLATTPPPGAAVDRPPTDPAQPAPYRPEPVGEWRRRDVRRRFADAVEAGFAETGASVPAVVGGHRFLTPDTISSLDPAQPSTVVAVSASCDAQHADEAVTAATTAWPAWRDTPVSERSAVLFRAAAWMRERRQALAALEVHEAAKPWAEADADVCEAIDFCEYYGREMRRLDRGGEVVSPPGERNSLRYAGRGVGAVIAPWNFPLAIPTGMVAAALVTGNAVVLKPAEQTPAVAARLVDAFAAAGLPAGVLNFVPGLGEDVGAALVAHPDVSFVVFTGSKDVGLGIVEAAAVHRPGQRHVKRVVAEMGGKNAIVVDGDADLDQAVPIVVASAFGYSGQKCSACSRLVVLDTVHDQLVERLVARTRELVVGPPRQMGVDMGPLIDADALARVQRYTEAASSEGEVVLRRQDVPAEGFYAGPTIVTGVDPAARLATEEIFGPVLAVLRAADFEHALALASDSQYALTAGIVSRSPSHISRAVRSLRAGNVYVNRAITGAVVGRQPFGGLGLSGVGSKAGGPEYLLQFVDPRVVSENTLRQGFAPDGGIP